MKNQDLECWFIEVGDQIVSKKAKVGYNGLESTEQMIYCLWVVDYSVRNSGTLGEVEEIFPQAISELLSFTEFAAFVEFKELLNQSDRSLDVFDFYETCFNKIAGRLREIFED